MFVSILQPLLHGAFVLLVALVLLFLSKVIYAAVHRRDLTFDLTSSDNPAVAVKLTGYLLAVGLVIGAIAFGTGGNYLEDALGLFLYGLLGNGLLLVASKIQSKTLFRHLPGDEALFEERNVALALARAGALVASGLVLAGSCVGEGGGILTLLVYFTLGQFVLLGIGGIYVRSAGFAVLEHLRGDNRAAGLSFAGTQVAGGILLFHAGKGDFDGWTTDLVSYAVHVALGFGLLPVLRLFFDFVWLPGVKVSREIANDKNWGMVILETSILIVLSLLFIISFS